jgi:cytochrome P450
VRADPFAPPDALSELREDQALRRLRYPDGHLGWLVTNHALGWSVLTDSRFSTRASRCPVSDPEKVAALAERGDDPVMSGFLLTMDPPEHTALRRMQTGRFTIQHVSQKQATIERVAESCLDAVEAMGPPVDLIATYAAPLTSLVLCELLGVPSDDRRHFERLTAIRSDPGATADEDQAACEDYRNYVRGVIEAKRADPGDDVLSDIVAREELTDDELAGVALQLFGAGHDTTATQLAMSVFVLLANRREWERLSSDFSMMGSAIEELLRYLTIVPLAPVTRRAREDVVIQDVLIREDECITVSLGTANRDPEKFERPDELDLTRDSSGHLALGQGRHMCLGQHLARLEMAIGLKALMMRFPTLDLAVAPHDVQMRDEAAIIFGPEVLPVTWS